MPHIYSGKLIRQRSALLEATDNMFCVVVSRCQYEKSKNKNELKFEQFYLFGLK